jgi:hypothetical protein
MARVWRCWWQEGFEVQSLEEILLQTVELRVRQGQSSRALKQEKKILVDSYDKFLKPLVLCP